MTNTNIPAQVITEDHRLEQTATKASETLAKHRWHWTLDESNPERVSIRAYARAVSRSHSTILKQVNGYAEWVKDGRPGATTLAEYIDRANMGAETEAATEAVSQARGNSFKHTHESRPTEVRRVREMARERAEQRGTTVAEEAPKVADMIVRTERAEQRQQQQRQERLGLRFVEMERHLDRAKRALTEAVNLAHDVPWGDEERTLLGATVDNVKALLGLIDMALTGSSNADWDKELAKLAGDES